jgi:hypothetical protein
MGFIDFFRVSDPALREQNAQLKRELKEIKKIPDGRERLKRYNTFSQKLDSIYDPAAQKKIGDGKVPTFGSLFAGLGFVLSFGLVAGAMLALNIATIPAIVLPFFAIGCAAAGWQVGTSVAFSTGRRKLNLSRDEQRSAAKVWTIKNDVKRLVSCAGWSNEIPVSPRTTAHHFVEKTNLKTSFKNNASTKAAQTLSAQTVSIAHAQGFSPS